MAALLRQLFMERRGSVMMEFIIVMPIYLVLFGGTCAIGDILVHSGRLLSADRFSAFFADYPDRQSVERWVSSMFRQPGVSAKWENWDYERAANGNMLNRMEGRIDSEWHYADATAPWSVCAAAKTTDDFYMAAGGGVAQVVAGKYWIEQGTGREDTTDFWADFSRRGYKTLHSRPGVENGRYERSFYILKRRKFAAGRELRTWRDVPASSLMVRKRGTNWLTDHGNSAWEDEVFGEGWFSASSIGDHGVKTAKPCPEANASAYWYRRYSIFTTWSN